MEGERIRFPVASLFLRRVQELVLSGHAADNAQIADELHTSRVTVGLWRQRFVDLGIECLEEAP